VKKQVLTILLMKFGRVFMMSI